MAMLGRKPAAPVSDPTRITTTITLTGRCGGPGRHKVFYEHTVTRLMGAFGEYEAETDCPECGRLTPLKGVG